MRTMSILAEVLQGWTGKHRYGALVRYGNREFNMFGSVSMSFAGEWGSVGWRRYAGSEFNTLVSSSVITIHQRMVKSLSFQTALLWSVHRLILPESWMFHSKACSIDVLICAVLVCQQIRSSYFANSQKGAS